MLNIEKIFDILDKVLKGTDDVQFTIGMEEAVFIRYANSLIHQNSIVNDVKILVSVINNNRIATTSVPYIEPKLLRKAIKDARRMTKVSKSIDGLPGLLSSSGAESIYGPIRKIEVKKCFDVVKKIIRKGGKYSTFGILKSGNVFWGIANSLGLRVYQSIPMDYVSVILMNDKHATSKSFNKIDFDINEIEKMKKKIAFKDDPDVIEPGEYTVILESSAVASVLGFMSFLAFNAKSVYEKISFFEENRKVFSDNVTIYDDKNYPSGIPLNFDFEGMERKKVDLIYKGVCKNVTSDRYYGSKIGKESTGHSTGSIVSPPHPNHLVFEKGEKKLEDMIASVEDGILVSSFHYVNTVRPKDLTLTGMTRYGTFLIKNGKIKKPLKNLRFTQSMVEAFSNIVEISSELEVHSSSDFYDISVPSHIVCPAIKINKFRFNGISDDSKTI